MRGSETLTTEEIRRMKMFGIRMGSFAKDLIGPAKKGLGGKTKMLRITFGEKVVLEVETGREHVMCLTRVMQNPKSNTVGSAGTEPNRLWERSTTKWEDLVKRKKKKKKKTR